MTVDEIIASSTAAKLARGIQAIADAVGPSRHFSGRWRVLGSDLQQPTSTDDEAIVHVVADSRFAKAVGSGLSRLDRFARSSRAAEALATLRQQLQRLAVRDRVRFGSLMLLTALGVQLALTTSPLRTRVPGPIWLVAFAVLTGAMLGARSVEAAWIDWSSRRARRQESGPA